METVEFINQTWQEIPKQDNPAMHYHKFPDGLRRLEKSIIIFKGDREAYRITDGGFVVAQVPLQGDITKLGVFWTIKAARLFVTALSV